MVSLLGTGYKYSETVRTSTQEMTGHTIRVNQPSDGSEGDNSDAAVDLAKEEFKNGQSAYVPVNNDKSTLDVADWKKEQIKYSELDGLNRTSVDIAYLSKRNLGKSEGRSRQVWNPTGWHNQPITAGGRWITPQSRGHLIAYTLTFNFNQQGNYEPGQPGSLDNPLNLATQSEFSNQRTMQIFEEKVKSALISNKKVIYGVQTVFRDNELMPRGYWVQGLSTDRTLDFNDYVWNIEPGVSFDYATGRSTVNPSVEVQQSDQTGYKSKKVVRNYRRFKQW